MTRQSSAAAPSAQLRHVVIMFCDLVDSTPLARSQNLESYGRTIETYQEVCRAIIGEHRIGAVDERHGDGLLACFGAARSSEDNAGYAVRKAIEIVEAVGAMPTEAGVQLNVRIGLHAGTVYRNELGDIYGEPVNFCARIQALADPGKIVASRAVHAQTTNTYTYKSLGGHTLKGIDGEHDVYEVVEAIGADQRRVHRWLAPFSGREGELATGIQALRQHEPLVVVGEPGIGKSRFAEQLVDRLDLDAVTGNPLGRRRLRLPCTPLGQGTGLQPLGEVLVTDAGVRWSDPPPVKRGRLVGHLNAIGINDLDQQALLSVMSGLDPVHPTRFLEADPSVLAAATFDAAEHWLTAALGDNGILIVEDAHWADVSTMEIVHRILSTDVPVIITTREVEAVATIGGHVIPLQSLPVEAIEELIDGLDKDGRLSPQRRAELVHRSDGVPLFAEELAASAVGYGDDVTFDATPNPVSSTVPRQIYDALAVRLDRIESDGSFLRAAAVVGRDFDTSLLAEVLGLSPETLDRALFRIIDSGLVELVDAGAATARFRHALMRDLVYETVPVRDRVRLHAIVGETYRRRASNGRPSNWSLAARHLHDAERFDDAAEALDRAADVALSRGAIVEARRLLGEAIDVVQPDGDANAELPLRLKRGYLAVSSEGNASPEAVADYDRCAELADHGDDLLQFITLISLWGHRSARGRIAEAYDITEQLKKLVELRYRDWEPENTAAFAIVDFLAGDYRSSLEKLEHAVGALTPSGPEDRVLRTWYMPNDPRSAMYTHLGVTSWFSGRWQAAERYLGLAADRASELPAPQGPHSLAYTKSYECWLAIESENHDYARIVLRDLSLLVERHGSPYWASFLQFLATYQEARLLAATLAPTEEERTRLVSDATTMGEIVGLWEMVEARALVPWALASIARVLVAAGDSEAAAETLKRAIQIETETGLGQATSAVNGLQAALSCKPRELRAAHDLAVGQGATVYQLENAVRLFELDESAESLNLVRSAVDDVDRGGRHPALLRATELLDDGGG